MAETNDCTKGMGLNNKFNNCFGIMTWSRGFREGKTYRSKEESYEDFKKIWIKFYGNHFPTWNDAAKWTGNDNPNNWLKNVSYYYYNK